MRDRRHDQRRAGARGMLAGSLGSRLLSNAADRPVDAFAIFGAVVATVVIIVNAVFLQPGARPAPFVANPALPKAEPADVAPKPAPRVVDLSVTHSTTAPHPQQVVPMPTPSPRRNDPIAELIAPSSRIQAVQRALSSYGYAQLKQSGLLDEPTSQAIEKFEREHKMPVTGRITDRLVGELATLIGHPLE